MVKTHMKKKVAAIIFILVLAVILNGCAFGGGKKAKDEPFATNTHTGTKGIEMRFGKDQPRSPVYYTGSRDPVVNILVEVWNRGAYTILSDELSYYLDGYDSSIIRMEGQLDVGQQIDFFDFEGKSNANPEGDFRTVQYSGYIDDFTTSWPGAADEYEPPFKFTVCYKYQTEATPLVCIDPDPFNAQIDRVCTVGDVSVASGQGAPVAVTSVEVDATPGRTFFKIQLANVGSGLVYDPACEFSNVPPDQDVHSCPFNLKPEDIGKIYYTVTLGGGTGTDVSCKPKLNNQEAVKLVDGKATLYCSITTDDKATSAYTTPLQINLAYGYMESITKRVTIINAAR